MSDIADILSGKRASSESVLPALRQDIEIVSEAGEGSSEGYLIYDGLRHRYFSIDHATSRLLSIWQPGSTPTQLSDAMAQRFGLDLPSKQIFDFADFLRANSLTADPSSDAWLRISQRAKTEKKSAFNSLIHNYLFFKLPLVRPQQALGAVLPYISFVFSTHFLTAIAVLGCVGAYLVSRQWDSFIHTFQSYFTFEGAAWFALSLIVVKTAHELGHAFTAVRYGCRIPTMGVAFMVLMPVLYTDVSDAWRLKDRHQRLLIDGAGMIVELGLACIATFLWAFLPDSPLRSVMFMIATTGWIVSLGVNLNPFMRFDGYYLLSDLIGIDNLQPRSFALGRWKLRQILLGAQAQPPEVFSSRVQSGLVLYAWATWLYRVIVFTGIAFLVYHYCFKALGIALFALEMWIFVVKPIVAEAKVWRDIIKVRNPVSRSTAFAAATFGLALIAFLPLSTSVTIPAVLGASDLTQMYPSRSAQVVSIDVARGQAVPVGGTIVKLLAPQIEKEIGETKINIDLIKLRLARAMVDEAEREQYAVLNQQLAGLQSKYSGLLKERDELVVRAPVAGSVLELGPDLHVGRWLGTSDPIALMASRERFIARGYVSESDVWRVARAATGRFIPDDISRPSLSVKVTGLAPAGAAQIEIPELASTHGGSIPVEADAKQRLVPVTAQYLVELEPRESLLAQNQSMRGVVELNGSPEHLLVRGLRNAWRVIIRESGF